MKNISIFLVLVCFVGCTNLNKQDSTIDLIEECRLQNSSKECDVIERTDLSLNEKENLIGWYYLNLNGEFNITQDYTKALYWFEKSAEANNNEALNSLGMMYHLGLGVTKDLNKAEKYYIKANEQNNKDSKFNLAELYKSSVFEGSPDYEKARSWYLLGIQDNPSRAYEGLSKIAIEQKNFEEAFIYSKKAAELGNTEAEYNLGVFFEQGVYVKKDIEKAVYWYRKAAKKGHKDAIHNLRVLASTGTVENREMN